VSELLAVTTVGGDHPGSRVTSELSWPMSEFLPADGGWYVRVREIDWREGQPSWPVASRLAGDIRGARYAWHPQPGLPPAMPWLSVSRVSWPDAPEGEVRKWLTGLYYAGAGIMVRASIETVEYKVEQHSASRLLVNGLNVIRGDFWDEGVLRLRINWDGPDAN
jgi:hypothetical protein